MTEKIKTKENSKEVSAKNTYKLDIDEMSKAGLHLGHKVSKLHPGMSDYVIGIKNTVHIIDMKKTAPKLEEALDFISESIKKGGKILLVGTKLPLRSLVKEKAEEMGVYYVIERWLGGTFTNFKIIRKRADHYKDLKKKKEEGELEKYTKKERVEFDRELENLRRRFEGIKDMEELPDLIFICDIVHDNLPLEEAKKKGIPTVGIVDTNGNPSSVDYPIPASDDAVSSVSYILDKVAESVKKIKNKL